MDQFIINGPTNLTGDVRISGAKNAVLPLMAAALLGKGSSVIENVPDLQDVHSFMLLIETLGGECRLEQNTLTINSNSITRLEAPYDLVRKMRASVYVLGPLLGAYGEARVSLPGGCAWGPRPVNLHLEGLRALGAEITLDKGYIQAAAPKGLRGGHFRFEPASVGATANILMAAVMADGETHLENCAREPEITQLAEALVGAGALIEGIGTRQLKIQGATSLAPIRHRVIPDRIEAGTFLAAGALAGGRVRLLDCQPDHLETIIAVLRSMGCDIEQQDDTVTISSDGKLEPIEVITRPFPNFPTDMQAQVMAACTVATGTSFITDSIYPDRFTHVAELRRLGADIRLDGSTAIVFGVDCLQGAPVMATDLRASAALVMAGVAARGQTVVNRVYHIDRGYENIEQKLSALGARIRRVSA